MSKSPSQARKNTAMKTCIKCNKIKPLTEFGVRPQNKDGRSGSCAEYVKLYTRAWNRANPDKCNAVLGLVVDDPIVLQNAINYLTTLPAS